MKKHLNLPVLALGHFVVDLACLYFYFTNFPQSGVIEILSASLLYNFLAFALQAPIGYFFDRFAAKRSTTIGFLFILCGYTLGLFHRSVAGVVLCGFGNAFFHVGGSIGIARTDKKGLMDAGIFVSTGALGVSLGTWLSNHGHGLPHSFASVTTFAILLLLIVLLLLQNVIQHTAPKPTSRLSVRNNTALLLLSLFAVFIRSFGGLFFPTSYKELFSFPENVSLTVFLIAIASGIVAFLGKFLGGFLSGLCTRLLHKLLPQKTFDLRSGNYIFGAITLLSSSFLLTLGGNVPVVCFLGILCFHAAMPVTLFELYCILPDCPGFAMGLSTVMLFLGYLPHELYPLEYLPASTILCVLTLVATGCMIASLLIYRRACQANGKGGSP